MRISTRGHYGLRAVIAISRLAQKGLPVSVNDVAREENLSNTYLEQLVSRLRCAGILRSHRGARGGYELVRDPDSISVAEVLRAAGEQFVFPECTSPSGCERQAELGMPCPSSFFWMKLYEAVCRVAEETSLGELLRLYDEEQKRRTGV